MPGNALPGAHGRPLIDPMDASERLSADDLASRREAEFLADALAVQQLRAAGGELVQPGVCTNCGERCLPRAVYCDADCRADHEHRLRATARQRRPLG
jgi:hypothetical protein